MGFESFWLQFNNGKKEQLGDTKSGIRKEQVDKKFHNLFDVYDTNQSEVLENSELEGIFKTLSVYAGNDKVLDNNENKLIASIFGANTNIQDINFQGFVKSVSTASADIVESKETQLEDGGKEIFTTYKDGTKETVGYYPNGAFKYKKTEKMLSEAHYYVEINGQKQEVDKQNYELALKRMEEMQAQQNKPKMTDGYQFNLPSLMPDVKISSQTEERPDIKYDFSGRAYLDIQARDFLLTHFIETHYGTQEALDTMGILDDIGAAINTGTGELWDACVNIYNKHFGNGTEEDYKNFYELVKKFEPQYDQAVLMKPQAEAMQKSPELYFRNFETDFENKTGNKYNLQEIMQFQQLAEQYQVASVLSMRMDCLKKALNEVRMYQSTQDALTYNPVQSEGMNPAQHLSNAQEYLLQYFDNDKEAADLILNGTIGNADKTLEAINSLLSDTELQLKDALNKKELVIKTDNDSLEIKAELFGSENYANFEELKAEYQKSYKAMYGTDFVPDELTDKVMSAKATGGFVKIAAITIVSILITKSPVMANIMKASAGAVVDGASANFIKGLVSKYGQTVVQQGIKFAMSTGTLATDVGLTLLNQVTDNREGINGEEVWETTKGAAKYIYFGAFVGSPIAQAVTQKVGKLGIAGKLFVNGTKTTQGAITTTSITGEQLVQNFMKASQSMVAKGAGFATDIAAFTLLDITTEDIAPGEALTSQAEMLTGLRIMHKAFEYMLGARTHTAIQKANWEAAIEKSGVKNWNIKEIKTPTADGKGFKVIYDVDFNGIPLGKMHDANALITAMMGKVSETYQVMETERSTKPKTETSKNEEVIIQEICDKYKDLSDKDLQAEIIRETALGNNEKVAELTIAFTQRGHKVSFADSEGKVVVEKVNNKINTEFEETQKISSQTNFKPMEIEVDNLFDNNIRSVYSDKKFPLYDVKGIDVEFSEKSGAKRLKRSKLPKKESVILVSQVGTNAGTSTLDKTLFTYEMIECAALAIVDKTNNRQSLIHVNPGLSVDANKAIIKHILSESNPKEVEISVVHGDSERTFGTVQFILDTIEEIAPTNKVNLYNFDKFGKYGGVILKNGELTCCDVNKPTLNDNKNIQVNPKENITCAIKKSIKTEAEVIETEESNNKPVQREALKEKIKQGRKLTTDSTIEIPKGTFEAPSVKFAETEQAFINIIRNNKSKIRELDKITDMREYTQEVFNFFLKETNLENLGVKLEIIESNEYGGMTRKDGVIEINLLGTNGAVTKADIIEAVAHEFNHMIQNKEMIVECGGEAYITALAKNKYNLYKEEFPDFTLEDYIEIMREECGDFVARIENDSRYTRSEKTSSNYQKALDYIKAEENYVPEEIDAIAYRLNLLEVESYKKGERVKQEYNNTVGKTSSRNPRMIAEESVSKSNDKGILPETEVKTSTIDKSNIETMSDAEFGQLKAQIEANPNFPKTNSRGKEVKLNKENIEFVRNLMETKELIDRLSSDEIFNLINRASNSSECANAKTLLLERIQNNLQLINRQISNEQLFDLLNGIESLKSLEVVDIILARPELFEGDKLINIRQVLREANNEYSVNFAKKILENTELLDSPNFAVHFPEIIAKSEFSITNETKLKIFNEFIKNPEYISNGELADCFGRILSLDVYNVKEYSKLLKNNNSEVLRLNLEKSQKTNVFENLFLELAKHKEFAEVSNKYYEMYLETEFTQYSKAEAIRFREMCVSINKEYGTKVILPANLKEVGQSLILIYQELNNYKMHSKGSANQPPVLNFLDSFLKEKEGAVAYVRDGVNNISIKQLSIAFIKHCLRHEMCHINDTKQLENFPEEIRIFNNEPKTDWFGTPIFDFETDLNIDKCKYVNEFRKAGIPEIFIKYAYSHPQEFIAVASSGDFSKYSPEFKNYLVELGMPKWMLNFQNLKPFFVTKDNTKVADNITIESATNNTSNPRMIIPENKTTSVRQVSFADFSDINKINELIMNILKKNATYLADSNQRISGYLSKNLANIFEALPEDTPQAVYDKLIELSKNSKVTIYDAINEIHALATSAQKLPVDVTARKTLAFLYDEVIANAKKEGNTRRAEIFAQCKNNIDQLRAEDVYSNLLTTLYKESRLADYSMSTVDIEINNVTSKDNSLIKVRDENGWFYRMPRRRTTTQTVDRISINALAEPNLIKALDELLGNGEVKGYYKTPNTPSDWASRHDPITIYLDEKASPEILEKVRIACEKYIRSTDDVLIGDKFAPGFALQKSPSVIDIENLLKRANTIDSALEKSLRNNFTKNGKLVASAGEFSASEKLLEYLQ